MRIDLGGTPTYFTTRHGKGISLIQGRSNVQLSNAEARRFHRILTEHLAAPDQLNTNESC